MKKILFFVVGMAIYIGANAQATDTTGRLKKDSSVFGPVEKVPEFPGGLNKLFKYINDNLRYPKQAKRDNIEGSVRVSFVVERDGSLTDIKIARSLSPETDAEAIRLITNCPKWIPGMQNGHPVRVLYSIPISFTLSN